MLQAISEAWRDRKSEILVSASEITRRLSMQQTPAGSETLTAADCGESILLLQREFDSTYGGFGRAPKFPPSMVLEALLRDGGERRRSWQDARWRQWREVACTTS